MFYQLRDYWDRTKAYWRPYKAATWVDKKAAHYKYVPPNRWQRFHMFALKGWTPESLFALAGVVAVVGLVIAAIAGWFMNIFALVDIINTDQYGMMILRGVGIIFAPLGAILGWV